MKKKKIFSLLMASTLCLSALTGCGSKPADSVQSSETQQEVSSEAPAQTNAGDSGAAGGGKQYEGVELKMWSMWTSSEPQAQVIQE
ncbi:MAG: carbohydrate ABC transporter substrate-binding protein, partial [Acetatifactor sp.]|nr:carbohydrate ABC transporter substrate-binding protein [Acetatifactor sp.]